MNHLLERAKRVDWGAVAMYIAMLAITLLGAYLAAAR